jgi:hypothetical protein
MLDAALLDEYYRLKKDKEALYQIFKKEPSILNSTRYTTAVQAFTNFCVDTLAVLAEDTEAADTPSEDVMLHLADYKTCKQCGMELIFPVDEKHYIESSNFLIDFPGWCYSCLLDHCCEQNCQTCSVSKDPDNCSFKDIKNNYLV